MKEKIKVEVSMTPDELKKLMVRDVEEKKEVKPYDETLPEEMQNWQ